MMNRVDRTAGRGWTKAFAVAGIVALAGALVGCGEKQEAKPAPKPAAEAPSPKPRQVASEASLDQVKKHPKVQFAELTLPESQAALNAIAALASAIAAGDSATMSQLISPRDQAVLKALVEQGEWQRQADATKLVRITTISSTSESNLQVGVAIEDDLGAFLTGWEATGSGDAWTFSGLAIESLSAAKAVELDGVALTLLALPAGNPVTVAALTPESKADDKKDDEKDEKKKSKPKKRSGGGGGLPPKPRF